VSWSYWLPAVKTERIVSSFSFASDSWPSSAGPDCDSRIERGSGQTKAAKAALRTGQPMRFTIKCPCCCLSV
jgi:hypothetical protein